MFPWSRSQKRTPVSAQLAQGAAPVELVYPQYLNVSMMMSSLAYIEGGVAWEEQRRTLAGSQSSTAKAGGASVGVPPLVSSLLSLDLRGNLSSKLEEQHGEEVTLVRRHTEASLFMALRSRLRAEGLIVSLDEAIAGRGHDELRRLVEVSGDVVRNPLVEVLAAFDLALPFMDQRGTPQTIHDKKHGQQPRQDTSGLAIFAKMKEELERSPLVDIILNPDDPSLPKCVLPLSREYLGDSSAENLLGVNLTVLGRVTKVLQEGQAINLLRRSVLRYLGGSARRELFQKLGTTPGLEIDIADTDIHHPAVQILPMALFA